MNFLNLFRALFLSLFLFMSAPALAQESSDAYDPFVDYSEFDANSDEEADINFFQNGRLFTLGLNVGYRSFTGTLGQLYEASPAFGLYLSYFFDLRFALQINYITGSHDLSIYAPISDTTTTGRATLNELGITLKYYFNTQNLTRGVAHFNPYITGGLYSVSRTVKISGSSSFGKDSGLGADIGFGLELPIRNDQMYLGIQGDYRLVNFKEENSEIRVNNNEPTGIIPNGDLFMVTFILGVNF